jgi:hypothetical protein
MFEMIFKLHSSFIFFTSQDISSCSNKSCENIKIYKDKHELLLIRCIVHVSGDVYYEDI